MAIHNPEIKYTKLFINNEFVAAESGKEFEVINPSTEDVICRVSEADKHDVDKAVAAARKAFHRTSQWRTMDASQRAILMHKLCDLIERDMNYLASLESLDNGKIFADSLGDLEYTVKTIRYYAGWCDKVQGVTIPCDGDFISMTRKEPVGVVGQIIPWNYPVMMLAWKWGPALAAGCCIVMKPSELTPLSALYLAALSKEAGFPDGVINVVPGFGPSAGAAVSEHHDIDKVAFTGSTAVGALVMQAAGKSNLKRVTFELGGKSPIVVFDDCGDLDEAVDTCHGGVMNNHGQNCCAASRCYVQESIYDEFVKRSVAMASKRVIGDPFDESSTMGPLINRVQMDKVLRYIESGKKEGAKLECGGIRKGSKGFFVVPTVFSNVTDEMTIAKEEIFGPVQSILKFSTMDEVIDRANKTTYGLASGVITKDINKALMFAQGIKSGSVWVNTYDLCQPQSPVGGYKQSGQGRELGEAGLEEYLETKTITIKIPSKF
ncbi:aldehyde dehydrogenase 1A1 [Oratosquilla oratoria]|uniref:aldehyde dehydrogenase 1A1 n=1 Tax=Oratosquilla oratoria TaxID=337810 RepID=UPI003F75DEBF